MTATTTAVAAATGPVVTGPTATRPAISRSTRPDRRPTLGEIVVCHSEHLVGLATVAVLERRGVAHRVTPVGSLTRLLSTLNDGVDVAVVFDDGGEEVEDLFEALRYRGLRTPVLVLTNARLGPERAARVLEWGATGVITTAYSTESLCRALAEAGTNSLVVPEEIRARVLDLLHTRRVQRYAAQRRLAALSPAERRVLRALTDGRSVSEIARHLSVSSHTVRSHVRSLGTKLECRGQLRIAATGRTLFDAARSAARDAPPAAFGRAGA